MNRGLYGKLAVNNIKHNREFYPAVSVDRDADGGILLYHAVPQSQSGTG